MSCWRPRCVQGAASWRCAGSSLCGPAGRGGAQQADGHVPTGGGARCGAGHGAGAAVLSRRAAAGAQAGDAGGAAAQHRRHQAGLAPLNQRTAGLAVLVSELLLAFITTLRKVQCKLLPCKSSHCHVNLVGMPLLAPPCKAVLVLFPYSSSSCCCRRLRLAWRRRDRAILLLCCCKRACTAAARSVVSLPPSRCWPPPGAALAALRPPCCSSAAPAPSSSSAANRESNSASALPSAAAASWRGCWLACGRGAGLTAAGCRFCCLPVEVWAWSLELSCRRLRLKLATGAAAAAAGLADRQLLPPVPALARGLAVAALLGGAAVAAGAAAGLCCACPPPAAARRMECRECDGRGGKVVGMAG